MKWFLFFPILFIAFNCSNSKKSNSSINESVLAENEELYIVLNNLFSFDLYETDAIRMETMKLHIGKSKTFKVGEIQAPPPPYIVFDREYFKALVNMQVLTNKEAEFMFENIDTTKLLMLDSLKINSTRIIRGKELSGFFIKYGFDSTYFYLKKIKEIDEYSIISAPIYSENKNKIILIVDTYCGELCGQGYVYIFEKKNNRWKILFKGGTWVC